jgi:hypothetical protein
MDLYTTQVGHPPKRHYGPTEVGLLLKRVIEPTYQSLLGHP